MCVLRYYTINRRDGTNPNKKERISFRQGFKENGIQNTSTIKKQKGVFCIFFIAFWRHGRAVRRGTANPFSPVQIRVSPDQQKNRNTLFCLADITCLFFSNRRKRRKRTLDTCLILSIRGVVL